LKLGGCIPTYHADTSEGISREFVRFTAELEVQEQISSSVSLHALLNGTPVLMSCRVTVTNEEVFEASSRERRKYIVKFS
jgi:hypothetical protein